VLAADLAWKIEAYGFPSAGQRQVSEGGFAISLARSLGIIGPYNDSESDARNALSALGISPTFGWLSDYPVTQPFIDDLYKVIGEAADVGRLDIPKEMALDELDALAARLVFPLRSTENCFSRKNRRCRDIGSVAEM